jgi:hypothetical protein
VNKNDVNNPTKALAYLLDCSLATVEEMATKKSKPKMEFERQISIAQLNFNWALSYCNPEDLSGTRAADVVKKHGNGLTSVKAWADSIVRQCR